MILYALFHPTTNCRRVNGQHDNLFWRDAIENVLFGSIINDMELLDIKGDSEITPLLTQASQEAINLQNALRASIEENSFDVSILKEKNSNFKHITSCLEVLSDQDIKRLFVFMCKKESTVGNDTASFLKKTVLKDKENIAPFMRMLSSRGYIEELERIHDVISKKDWEKSYRKYDFYIVNTAALYGQVDSLKYLMENAPSKKDWVKACKSDNYMAVRWAAEYGHLDVLSFLKENTSSQKDWLKAHRAEKYNAVTSAALAGHADVFQYLLNDSRLLTYPEQRDLYTALAEDCSEYSDNIKDVLASNTPSYLMDTMTR